MAQSIGQHVRERRKGLKLTQVDLATRMGWDDRSYLSRIEHDEIKAPAAATVLQLANGLEESLDEFLTATGMRDLYMKQVDQRPESPAQERIIAFTRARLAHLTEDEAEQLLRIMEAGFAEQRPD